MPFVSKAQMRYLFANDPERARQYAEETPDIKNLPNRAPREPKVGIKPPKVRKRWYEGED